MPVNGGFCSEYERSSHPEVFCKKHSWKFYKIYRKTPVTLTTFLSFLVLDLQPSYPVMMPYGPIYDAHSTTILYLAKVMSSSYGSKYCWPIKLQDFLECSISRKKWMRKFVFDMQINIEVFYKLIVSSWVCESRHAQITQNKIAYLCNTFRKTCETKLIFCLQINMKLFNKLIA